MNHVNTPEVPPDIYSKDYYLTDNEGCREYSQGLDKNIHPKFKRALELANIKAGDIILDIGCGRGELLYYCTLKGAKSLGIDYSDSAIEIAQQTIKRLPTNLQTQASAKVADVVKADFPDKYNVIFMIEIAEHMYDWQLQESFQKINQILANDGRLIIMTPNYYYEKYLQPLKYFLDIPFRLFKWPLRVLRGKYQPKNFQELLGKIFKIKVDRGDLNRRMHVNVTTPGRMKSLLKNFDIDIHCEDHSMAPISLLLKKWWGLEIVIIAKKKK